jgi:hypothetical protein
MEMIMQLEVSNHTKHALDDSLIGRTVVVRQVHFEGLRSDCERVGVREGQVFRLNARNGSHLLLESRDGRTAKLRREYARFIEVEDLGGSAWP